MNTRPVARASSLLAAIAISLVAFTVGAADEAGWPDHHPIRIIVPGGAGGVTDIRARWLAERLGSRLGVPVVVENKPGAGGNMGTEFGVRSAPDGYTLVVIHQGTMTFNPHLYARPGYDALTDLTPITTLGQGPLLLAVNPSVPATSVGELVALAKANPGRLTFASPGVGTPPHIAGELFKRAAGIDVAHVPYKGGGQAVSDLIAGHTTFSIEGLTVQLPQVKAGRLRALAVTGSQRIDSLPDVPTMEEAGIAGYRFIGWVGLAVPLGTPPAIVQRLYRQISAILATPDARAWFAEAGADTATPPPDAFAASIRAEHAKAGALIRDAGIRLE